MNTCLNHQPHTQQVSPSCACINDLHNWALCWLSVHSGHQACVLRQMKQCSVSWELHHVSTSTDDVWWEHTYLWLHWCYEHLNAVLELGRYAAEVPLHTWSWAAQRIPSSADAFFLSRISHSAVPTETCLFSKTSSLDYHTMLRIPEHQSPTELQWNHSLCAQFQICCKVSMYDHFNWCVSEDLMGSKEHCT